MKDIKNLQTLLKITYGVVPIVAGLDKFLHILTDWQKYLGFLTDLLPFDPTVLISVIGMVEMAAGVLVLTKTKIGSLIVTAWLVAIALTLVINGLFDIAVRDVVMAIGSFTLYQLTLMLEHAGKTTESVSVPGIQS